MYTSYAVVCITNLLAVYRRFGVLGIYSFSVVVLRTLAVVDAKGVMVLLLELFKTFLNGFEVLVCRSNIHGSVIVSFLQPHVVHACHGMRARKARHIIR